MTTLTEQVYDFDKQPSLAALQSTAYELNNLKSVRIRNRDESDQMLFAVNHGFDLTIIRAPMAAIKQCQSISQIHNNDAVRTHKLPYDSIEQISAFQWINLKDDSQWFVIGTESSKVYFYDVYGIHEISMVDCIRKDTDSVCPASVLCISHQCTCKNELLVGLSNGKVVCIPLTVERKPTMLRVDSAVSSLFKASSSITALWMTDNDTLWVGTGKGTLIQVIKDSDGEATMECALKSKLNRDGITSLQVCQDFAIMGTELGSLKIVSTQIGDHSKQQSGLSVQCFTLPVSALDVCPASTPPESLWIVVASEEGTVMVFHFKGWIHQTSLVHHSIFHLRNTMICGIQFALKPFVDIRSGLIQQSILPQSSTIGDSDSEIDLNGKQSAIQPCNQHILILTAYDRNGFLLMPGPHIKNVSTA